MYECSSKSVITYSLLASSHSAAIPAQSLPSACTGSATSRCSRVPCMSSTDSSGGRGPVVLGWISAAGMGGCWLILSVMDSLMGSSRGLPAAGARGLGELLVGRRSDWAGMHSALSTIAGGNGFLAILAAGVGLAFGLVGQSK